MYYICLVHLHLEFYIDRPAGVQVYSADDGEEVAGRTRGARIAQPSQGDPRPSITALRSCGLQGSQHEEGTARETRRRHNAPAVRARLARQVEVSTGKVAKGLPVDSVGI